MHFPCLSLPSSGTHTLKTLFDKSIFLHCVKIQHLAVSVRRAMKTRSLGVVAVRFSGNLNNSRRLLETACIDHSALCISGHLSKAERFCKIQRDTNIPSPDLLLSPPQHDPLTVRVGVLARGLIRAAPRVGPPDEDTVPHLAI